MYNNISPRHYTVEPMSSALGNLFKCHEEVSFLQPLIPPKRFDIFFPIRACINDVRKIKIGKNQNQNWVLIGRGSKPPDYASLFFGNRCQTKEVPRDLDHILWGWKFKILENRNWVDFGFRANVCIPAKNYLMGLWKLKIKQSRHGGVLDTK